MLAEFEIVDGVAKRKPVTALVLGAKHFLLGGIGDLEKVLVRGERLPTWQEVGLSALEVAFVAGGVGAVAKVARPGGRSVVEKGMGKGTGRLMAEGAYAGISSVAKMGVHVAPIAFAYIMITRPSLIAPAVGWIAEQLGIDRRVGIFVVYLIAISLILEFLRRLIWCGWVVGSSVRRFLHVFVDWSRRSRSQAVLSASS